MKNLFLLSLCLVFLFSCNNNEPTPTPIDSVAKSTTDTTVHGFDKAAIARAMPTAPEEYKQPKAVVKKFGATTVNNIHLSGAPNIFFDGSGQIIDTIWCDKGGGNAFFSNVVGRDSLHPTVIIPYKTVIRFDDATADAAFQMGGCKYVKVTGGGLPGIKYGFIFGKGGTGSFDAHYGSTNIEIDSCDIGSGSLYAGLIYRTYPSEGCQWSVSGGWAIRGMKIHDNNIHDVPGEGIYAGCSHYGNVDANGFNPVSGNPLGGCSSGNEAPIMDADIRNNIFTNIGYDGIQLSGCIDPARCSVTYNTIIGFGNSNTDGQDGGITYNPGSVGTIAHNWIEYNGTGQFSMGIMWQGQGDTHIYDNVLKSNGKGQVALAMLRNTSANVKGSTHTGNLKFINNTISGWGTGYWWYGDNGFGNSPNTTFENQIIQQTPTISSIGNGSLANLNLVTCVQVTGSAGLNSDLTLAAGSQAINFGTNEPAIVPVDYANKAWNAKYDAGAFAYNGVTPPPVVTITVNITPATQTITLPTNSVSLTGSAVRSPVGTLTYQWTGSCGSCVITTPNALSTTVTNLSQGTWSFALQAKDAQGNSGSNTASVTVNPAGGGTTLTINITPKSTAFTQTAAVPAGTTNVAVNVAACPTTPPPTAAKVKSLTYNQTTKVWTFTYTDGTTSTLANITITGN